MSKVLFIKYVPHSFPGNEANQQKSLLAAANCAPSTVIVLKNKGGLLNIQGFPDIPSGEKAKAWDIFMQSVKQLLAVPVDKSLCVRFADPPCTPVTSLAQILQEPRQIVNLIASPLPYAHSAGLHSKEPVVTSDPYSRYHKMFHSKGIGKSSIKPKCDFAEMERLLSQLEEVNQCLERTRQACDKMAAKCSPQEKKSSSDLIPVCRKKTIGETSLADDETDDQKVVQLLEIAEAIVQTPSKIEEPMKKLESQWSEVSDTCLPAPPTDISVQPSITSGAVYVMWQPVRLDAEDMNHGHTVLGYKVHFDKHMRVEATGALSSQAEILSDLEEGEVYNVQVCTHTNHCNSLLSAPFQYRHTTKQSSKQPLSKPTNQESKTKAARVESWLQSGHISSSPANQQDSLNGKPFPNHHVHFAAPGNTSWGSTQLLDSGCEDTRSTASSHTSGIVTDFPASPYMKQASPFSYLHCPMHADNHSLSTGLHSDDGFHTLTRCACLEQGQSSIVTKSTASSTLCPSQRSSIHNSMDTVIDEPLGDCQDSKSISTCVFKPKLKRPSAPENLTVFQDNSASNHLLLEWTPIRRDERGCNNGFFILGYRIYINDKVFRSVDGAFTSQAKIKYPRDHSLHHIKIDIRSRAMASESTPSNPVYFSHLSTRHSKVTSNSTNLRSGISGHSKSITRMETYV